MAQYVEVNGQTVEFPDGMAVADIETALKANSLSVPVSNPRMTDAPNALATGLNKGLLGLAGMGVDTIANVRDLGKAALGTPFLLAGKVPPAALQVGDRANDIGSGANLIANAPKTLTATQNPDYEGGYLQAAGTGLTGAIGGPGAATRAALGMASSVAAKKAYDESGSNAMAITASLLPFGAAGSRGSLNADRVKADEAARVANALAQTKRDTLKAGQDLGYVLPPSAVNPSFVNKRLEGIAGKDALKQESAIRNQEATTKAAAKDLIGFPSDKPLTKGTLDQHEYDIAKPYREVAGLSTTAKQDLEAWKQSRAESRAEYKHYSTNFDPAVLKRAKDADAMTAMLEQSLEGHAASAGRPDLIQQLRFAKVQLAKSNTVDRALNVGDSSVSAPVLGRLVDKGAPLTDNLKTIGDFQQAFPGYMREGARVPTPGVSKAEALSSGLFGLMGHAASGAPGLFAAGIPLISHPTRAMLLSKPYQSMIANLPNAQAPATLRLLQLMAQDQPIVPALTAQGLLSQ